MTFRPHRAMVLAYLGGFIFALGIGNGHAFITVIGFLLTLSSTVDLYLQVTQKER